PALDLLRRTRALGKPAIYCTDDDFARLPAETELGKVYRSAANGAAYESLLSEADLVWVFSEEMAAHHRAFCRRVLVGRLPCPLERVAPPSAPSSEEQAERERDGVLTIGYAGRFVHERDLDIAVRPLLRLLDERGSSLRLEFVDCLPAALRGHPRVRFVPYFEELLDYYRYMAGPGWSIRLALLADDDFNPRQSNVQYP